MRHVKLLAVCALVGALCAVMGHVQHADARPAPPKALVKSHLRAERALAACARHSRTPARWAAAARREGARAQRARKVHVRRGSTSGLVRSRARVRLITGRCNAAKLLRPARPAPAKSEERTDLPSRLAPGDGAPPDQSEPTERVSAPQAATELARRLERLGRGKLGARYVWGTQGPGTFDCSGLTWWLYDQVEVKFGRSSTFEDWRTGIGPDWTRGRAFAQLRPGDLVYLRPSAAGPQHVGLYLGDGQLLHASSGAGRVIVSDLTSGYYRENYIGWLRHDAVGGDRRI